MRLERITDNFADMESLNALAKEAFPPEEYLAPTELIDMQEKINLDFWALYDDDRFVGFMTIVTHEQMAYLFFLAIDALYRSNGYGGKALAELFKQYPTYQQVVDMEMLDEHADNKEQRITRRKFYLRNGYKPTGHYLTYFGVSYEVLCKDEDFDFEMFKELLKVLPIKEFNPVFFQETSFDAAER